MRTLFRCVILLCLGLVSPLWAQLGNSVLTGTVEDPTQARIPGVTITALNTQTSVQTVVLSNESGAYNMPNLLPGTYTLRASLPGFQTQAYEKIELGGNQTQRFNFTLKLAQTQTQVEVTVDAQQLLTQSGGTVGDVLPETAVRQLPLVGNDVLDLVNVLGGVQLAPNGAMSFAESADGAGSRFTTLAGISATYVNTTVNGVSVTDSYYAGIGEPDNTSGILSVTRINPELVSEVRLILTPVDAELGRGNGQVQITTRSGTNSFRGAARWDVRNPALNARTWLENSTPGGPPPRNWYNQNQATVSYGGPIVRSKTFFFALYDQNIVRQKNNVNNTVPTPCARNGIFRYFPGWVNGNALANTPAPTTVPNQSRPVVDLNGNPLTPTTNSNGTAYTDRLRYVSVFGPIDFANFPATVAPDCSNIRLLNGTLQGASSPSTAWDTNRWNFDPTGFISKVMKEMPGVTNYEIGDGLNTAGSRYIRRQKGSDGGGFQGAVGATSDSTNRKQINIKIDHVITPKHKLATQWSHERDDAFISPPSWEQGFWGSVRRRPHSFSANLSSTLSPTMLNDFKFGLRLTSNNSLEAMDDPDYRDASRDFFPVINSIPVIVGLPIVGNYMMNLANNTQGNKTSTYTFADTLSWTRSEHSFRFGGEVRMSRSDAFSNPNVIPRTDAGAGDLPIVSSACTPACDFEGLLDTNVNYGAGDTNHFQDGNQTLIENLLLLHSGSMGNMNQFYFLQYGDRLNNFESYSTEATRSRIWRQNEMALFFQDDWKMTRDLTVNLGLRWEYYGVPWEGRGLLPAPAPTNLAGAFGISGNSWSDWWRANPQTNGQPTVMEFIGKGSPNPDRQLYPGDKNNFGPVIGFAWNVPWFGQGRTVLRGGYSVTFQGGGNIAALDGTAGEVPGAIWPAEYRAATNTYARLANFGTDHKNLITPGTFTFRDYPFTAVVPLPPDGVNPSQALRPMAPVPLRFRPLAGIPTEFYDDTYLSPYVQNFTFSVTRNLRRNLTLDVRYVGTVARKLFVEAPINQPNFLYNGLKEAFDLARSGQESTLLNDLTTSVNAAFGGSGSAWLRAQATGAGSANMANSLARGDYANLANYLAFTNGSTAGGVLTGQTGEQGLVLHRSTSARFPNGVPDNFIIANPQFGNLNIVTNLNSSNYHSLQTQFTMRPTLGMSYQGTFTWSRMLGSPNAINQGGGAVSFYSMDRRGEDYGLQFQHRKFDFRGHGTFVLPIGPSKLLFGNTSGWVARLIEDWQLSTIFNMTSGMPNTIVSRSALYESLSSSNFGLTPANNAPPDLALEGLAAFGDFAHGIGKVDWGNGASTGTYFKDFRFVRVPDPQCANVPALASGAGQTLRSRCDSQLSAVARVADDGSQVLVFQNPQPGTRGNLGTSTIEGPGLWTIDASMSKSFQIDEVHRLQIRFDATNVLNHPNPCSPGFCPGQNRGTNLTLNNNTNDFGLIGVKTATRARQFQASVRLDF
jgi:Carboxypeptidase regulatory-like domain